VKKWIITILAALATLALALTAHWWAPWLLSFATQNNEDIEHLNTLGELVSKLVLWPLTAILFIISLWQKRKEDAAGRQSPPAINSGRDTNTAGRDLQTDGVSVKDDASVNGDVFGGNKTINGDQVSGDKIVTGQGDVVKGNKIVYEAPAPVLASPFQLPPPPADFTGRTAELAELRAAIEKGGVHISGLQGQGGVGKTALALKLVAELAPNFPDAQIYLDLKGVSENPLTAAEAMSHVLRTFHPEAKLPEKEDDLCALYRSVLHNKRALLLMDNAKDADQIQPLIPPPNCVLLVTSRYHFVVEGLHARNLDTLPPEDAANLLLRIAPRIDCEAEAVAKLCGYLALALRLAATAVAERIDLAPADYRQKLMDERNRLKLLGGDKGVTASITLSYNLLDAETQKRWRMLAVFPDTFYSIAAAAVWEIEDDPTQETLSRLLQYSMLEWDNSTQRYRMHDLMRAFAREKVSEEERKVADLQHAQHYLAVIRTAGYLYMQGGESLRRGLALFDLEWGNIQAGQSWAAQAESGGNAAMLCSDFPDGDGAYILGLRQHPRESIHWRESALAAARKLKRRSAEAAHLGNLGIAYDSLGEYGRAIEHYEQHLAIAREVGDRQGVGKDLGNMGNAYIGIGEYRRAAEYHEQALAIDREIADRRGEGQDLGNLGIAHHFLGEYRRAIECYEQALAIAREIGDRLGEGQSLGNMGNAYRALGEHRRAIEYYEQHLAIDCQIGDRRGEGTDHWNMSLLLDELGDRKNAIAHAEAALKIYEQIEHPNTVKVRKQLDSWRNS
jgi:tetratricopeptide (TPR) repeat protein